MPDPNLNALLQMKQIPRMTSASEQETLSESKMQIAISECFMGEGRISEFHMVGGGEVADTAWSLNSYSFQIDNHHTMLHRRGERKIKAYFYIKKKGF